MGLIAAEVGLAVATLSAGAGERIAVVAWSRGGATSFSVTPNAGGASWQTRVAEATNPGDDTSRRSLAVAELRPVSAVSAVEFTADWSGDATNAIWMVVEEGTGWDFAGAAVADSDTSSVTSLGTGSTSTLAAGDVLGIAGAAIRDGGSSPAAWSTTDVNPALVGGGSVLLDEYDGAGAGGNAGAAGYLAATGQSAQAWSDTLSLDAGRMCTVALVTFVNPAATAGRPAFTSRPNRIWRRR